MTAPAACALSDLADPTADPLQVLANLAAQAMRIARRAVEQYEALTSRPAQTAETTRPLKQPDPGTLFTRAARIVLDCINKEIRLLAGLPLAPARPRAIPQAESAASETSYRNESVAEPIRQALRTVTRNHPHGEKLLRQGLEQLETALAATPAQPIEISDLLLRVCTAAGIRLDPGMRRKLARDPVFESLPVRAPVPS
ncbi:MAG TPA: hypothetical protein VMB71_00755 [Acetobacteraceae bacterium]|nr:hypothetical protein [Acetobacteraceae bacterium]